MILFRILLRNTVENTALTRSQALGGIHPLNSGELQQGVQKLSANPGRTL